MRDAAHQMAAKQPVLHGLDRQKTGDSWRRSQKCVKSCFRNICKKFPKKFRFTQIYIDYENYENDYTSVCVGGRQMWQPKKSWCIEYLPHFSMPREVDRV